MDVDAVLLDLDGTLVDSYPALVRSWSTWAAEYGVGKDEFTAVVGHGLTSAAIVRALVPSDQAVSAQRRIDELEATDLTGIQALPGAREFTGALPSGRWAIVTSGNAAVATARAKAAGISHEVMVTADDVREGKPHPEPYLLGAKLLGVPPARCVVVEDAPAGLAAARAAGMRSIAVTTQHPASELDADIVVEGLHKLRVTVDGQDLRIQAVKRA
jgi:sugar-phosphatase